jgi:hypothetical protein
MEVQDMIAFLCSSHDILYSGMSREQGSDDASAASLTLPLSCLTIQSLVLDNATRLLETQGERCHTSHLEALEWMQRASTGLLPISRPCN